MWDITYFMFVLTAVAIQRFHYPIHQLPNFPTSQQQSVKMSIHYFPLAHKEVGIWAFLAIKALFFAVKNLILHIKRYL
jgi:hypothetical protein